MKVTVVSCLAVLFLTALGFGQQEEEGLKIVHQRLVDSVGAGDIRSLERMIHPRGAGFFRDSQLPVLLSGQVKIADIAPTLLAELSQFSSTSFEAEFRVIGDVGIVCARGALVPLQLKGRKANTIFRRSTFVYHRMDGMWTLVSWHGSELPVTK